jgi:N-acetylglucosamine-6-phosphate deacetylase
MTKDSQIFVEGIHYATGRQVKLDIRNGQIHRIIENGNENTTNTGLYIAPGLIDNQINGYANVDFSGNNLTPDGFLHATRQIWKSGVTTFLPTLITNSHDNL